VSESAEIVMSSPLPTMPPPGAIAESVLVIGAPGAELVGVLSRPADAARTKPVGVVIVVGGPQTRVGSHRQFTIMARALAAAGHACLRFDYTGMGDSPGPRPDFEKAGPDIGRACDALLAQVPGCQRIALWGLCDGATAAIFYAQKDPRIAAVIAANPWARSEATRAQAIVAEHYGSRLRSGEFWKKLLTGKVNVLAAGAEAVGNLLRARGAKARAGSGQASETLPDRLSRALASSASPVRLQLSGKDLTAAEFEIAMKSTGASEGSHVSSLRLADADHTLSDPELWLRVIEDACSCLRAAEPDSFPRRA
jgi:exosortase A-associated hydrolase 1